MEPINPAPAIAAPAVVPPVAMPPAPAVVLKANRWKNRCNQCMYPVYQDAIWGKKQPRGARFQCPTCNTRYVVGSKTKYAQDGSLLYHTLFRRGIADRSVPSWQYFPDMKKVYITCVCGPLLPIELADINAGGFVGEGQGGGCTQCDYCGLHFWPFLEGWAALARSERARKAARARWDRVKAKEAAGIQS